MARTLPVAPRPFRYAVVLSCAIFVLYASLTDPGDAGPSTLFGVETTVYLHLVAYAALAGAVGYALLAADGRALLVAATVAAAYGAGVELLQGLVAYRTASAFDALVNGAGAVLGALLWRAVAPLFGVDQPGRVLGGTP